MEEKETNSGFGFSKFIVMSRTRSTDLLALDGKSHKVTCG